MAKEVNDPSVCGVSAPIRNHSRARIIPLTRIGLICFFAGIAAIPVVQRVFHPTILGDDVIRVVNLIENPLSGLLFRPFGEHVAPSTEVVSWLTWQSIGQDLRLAPLGFCVAAVIPWVLLLLTFAVWLKRETGCRTAALVSVAAVAQSPLALEVMWWYSASTFTWAILGLLVAILGASLLKTRPRWALTLIMAGAGLGPSFSTIGILAAPLVMLRAGVDPGITRRRRILGISAAVAGFGAYMLVCELGGMSMRRSIPEYKVGSLDLSAGLAYTLAVPGQILLPALFAVPPSWTIHLPPRSIGTGLGLLTLGMIAGLALRARQPRNRLLILLGAAMIYLGYGLIYCSRVCLVKQGKWTEAEFLYEWAGRYHVLPLLGLAAVLATVLASLTRVRNCDQRPLQSWMIGVGVGLLAFTLNRPEAHVWNWMLKYPDQGPTLRALHRVGEVARAEGISRDQVITIFDPEVRPWNFVNPFPLTRLVAQTPQTGERALQDDQARTILLTRLTPKERLAIEAGACVSVNPPKLDMHTESVATGQLIEVRELIELGPGRYRFKNWPAYLEYAFDSTTNARLLELPGLASDQNLHISWADGSGHWSYWQRVCWLGSATPGAAALIDLDRLTNWPSGPVTRIRISFTRPDQEARIGEPRLLR